MAIEKKSSPAAAPAKPMGLAYLVGRLDHVLNQRPARPRRGSGRCRALHGGWPVLGPAILAVLMFLVFQAVFSWAAAPMDLIKTGVEGLGAWVGGAMSDGPAAADHGGLRRRQPCR